MARDTLSQVGPEVISREDAKRLGLKTFFTGKPCSRGHVAPRYTSNSGCLDCHKANGKAWEQAHPGYRLKQGRAWRAENPDKVKEATKRRYWADPAKAKAAHKLWREANPEYDRLYAQTAKRKATMRAWAEANPDKCGEASRRHYANNKEKRKAAHRTWRLKNPERYQFHCRNYEQRREEKRAWREANADKWHAWAKRWRERYPERHAAVAARRRAGVEQATPAWVDKLALLAFYEDARRMTESTGTLHHVDHIVPLKGKTVCGLHVPWNLRVIPAVENMRKSNRLLADLLM